MNPKGDEPVTGGSGEPIPPGETRHYTAEGTVVPSTGVSQPGNLQTPGMANAQTPGMTNAQTPGMTGVRMPGMVGPPSPTTPGPPPVGDLGLVGPTPYQGKPIPAGGGGLTGPPNTGATGAGGNPSQKDMRNPSLKEQLFPETGEKKPEPDTRTAKGSIFDMSIYRGWGGMPDSQKSMLLKQLLAEDPAGNAAIQHDIQQGVNSQSSIALRVAGIGEGAQERNKAVSAAQDKYIAQRTGAMLQSAYGVAAKKKIKDKMREYGIEM